MKRPPHLPLSTPSEGERGMMSVDAKSRSKPDYQDTTVKWMFALCDITYVYPARETLRLFPNNMHLVSNFLQVCLPRRDKCIKYTSEGNQLFIAFVWVNGQLAVI